MSNDLTQQQIEELTNTIKNAEPVPISIQMTEQGLKFVTDTLMILNKEKYVREQGIQIVKKGSVLSKYEARVLYSDNSSRIINLREEK